MLPEKLEMRRLCYFCVLFTPQSWCQSAVRIQYLVLILSRVNWCDGEKQNRNETGICCGTEKAKASVTGQDVCVTQLPAFAFMYW